MKNVVVTGANGHLGYSIVKHLLERQYRVRATVRNAQDVHKTAMLRALGVELVEADLGKPASLLAALEGMDGLFQVAAVFDLTSDNAEKTVIRPNVEGTGNILLAAHQTGIKKIVYTSSIAAVGTVAANEQALDERHWNDSAREPYAISKTRSEKLAWQLAEEYALNMVTILPSALIGPDFQRLTATLALIQNVLDGKMPMALPTTLGYTDVRDVALAHILAYENDSASGRYIANTATLSMVEALGMVKALLPQLKVSERVMPVWLAHCLPALDYLNHVLTRAPRQLKRETTLDYVNREQRYASTRLVAELQWHPRPIETTFADMVKYFEVFNSHSQPVQA